MSQRVGFLAAAAIALLLAPSSLASTPPVEVHADAGWTATGVIVEPGQTYSLAATGMAFTVLPDASTTNTYFHPVAGVGRGGRSGPGGQPYICSSYPAGTCAVEGAPFGQLVGRVAATAFSIGDAPTFTIPASASAGELELAVNDFVEWYFDNSGSYLVWLG